MKYQRFAPFYDIVAPYFSRYRSPAVVAQKLLALAQRDCELLDVGVGTGLSIAPYMHDTRFVRIVGVDPSAAMLERCRRKFIAVELHHGTIDDLAARARPFDIIQSVGAIEHVGGFDRFCENVVRLLKPGGHFVFTFEPEIDAKISQWQGAPHLGTLGSEPVFRRRPGEVEGILSGAGLELIEATPFKAYLGLVHHLVIARRLTR